jgi:hypothetical protein
MTVDVSGSTLADLEWVPYLTPEGDLPEAWIGKIGVYAIFDQAQTLQFIGYSRDVSLSLKQHLVRRPQQCHWVKVVVVEKPSRTILEGMRDRWIEEQGSIPIGNAEEEALWTQPIDAKAEMTEEEHAKFAVCDGMDQVKLLKQVARRVEQNLLKALEERGVTFQVRFNPKMKEEGLLDVKPGS